MSLQIRQLSYALGAEIMGIDLRKPLDDKSFTEIHDVFLEHCVLLFRGQPLTRGQHVAFSRRFGELDTNDAIARGTKILQDGRDPEYPEIILNRFEPGPGEPSLIPGSRGEKNVTFSTVWHSDQPFDLRPPSASLLRAVAIPQVGGDTMFANLYLAYETLSDGMKKLIEGIYGVHPVGQRRRIDNSTPERAAETNRHNPPAAQPLVRVHPETGRKSLFLGDKVKQLVGFTLEEGVPLVQFLIKHATRPQFIYRHQWRKDDLIVWDNRCTNHLAVGDYDNAELRHMERTTVKGTPSGYVYDGRLQ